MTCAAIVIALAAGALVSFVALARCRARTRLQRRQAEQRDGAASTQAAVDAPHHDDDGENRRLVTVAELVEREARERRVRRRLELTGAETTTRIPVVPRKRPSPHPRSGR